VVNFGGTVGDEPEKKDFRRHADKRNTVGLIGHRNAVNEVKRACNKFDKEVGDGYQKDQPESVVDAVDNFSGQNQTALPSADVFLIDLVGPFDVQSNLFVK
jgi:hypothetical protein